jgi:hypothetical protein
MQPTARTAVSENCKLRKRGLNYLAKAVRSRDGETYIILVTSREGGDNKVEVHRIASLGKLEFHCELAHNIKVDTDTAKPMTAAATREGRDKDVVRDIAWSHDDFKDAFIAIAYSAVVLFYKFERPQVGHVLLPYHQVDISDATETVASVSWLYFSIPTAAVMTSHGSVARVIELPRGKRPSRTHDLTLPNDVRGRNFALCPQASISMGNGTLIVCPPTSKQSLVVFDNLMREQSGGGVLVSFESKAAITTSLVMNNPSSGNIYSYCSSSLGEFFFAALEGGADETSTRTTVQNGRRVPSATEAEVILERLRLPGHDSVISEHEQGKQLIQAVGKGELGINNRCEDSAQCSDSIDIVVPAHTDPYRRSLPGGVCNSSAWSLTGVANALNSEVIRAVPRVLTNYSGSLDTVLKFSESSAIQSHNVGGRIALFHLAQNQVGYGNSSSAISSSDVWSLSEWAGCDCSVPEADQLCELACSWDGNDIKSCRIAAGSSSSSIVEQFELSFESPPSAAINVAGQGNNIALRLTQKCRLPNHAVS